MITIIVLLVSLLRWRGFLGIAKRTSSRLGKPSEQVRAAIRANSENLSLFSRKLSRRFASLFKAKSSCKLLYYKEKGFAADMKRIYNAPTRETAAMEHVCFEQKWNSQYSDAICSWKNNWDNRTRFFDFSTERTKTIYTTNLLEKLNEKY